MDEPEKGEFVEAAFQRSGFYTRLFAPLIFVESTIWGHEFVDASEFLVER